MPLKVVLDTDIGSDVDDLFALAMILASPEIEVVGITVVSGDTRFRAKMVLKMLELAGREDIPVSLGESYPMQAGLKPYWFGNEGHGIDWPDDILSRLDPRPSSAFLLETIAENPGEIVALTIGPMTNFGIFARDHHLAYMLLRSVMVMGGNYLGINARSVKPEYNFMCDPEAVRQCLSKPRPTRIAGLNVTEHTKLARSMLSELQATGTQSGDILAKAGGHYMNQRGRDWTNMHDPLAVAALIDPGLLEWKRVKPRVQTEGEERGVVTFIDDASDGQPGVEIATRCNTAKFQDLFWERILAFARTSS